MKRIPAVVVACWSAAHSTLLLAGLDRAGNVLHEDGDSGPVGWVMPVLIIGLAILAWRQSEQRTSDRIHARKESDRLKKELWEAKDRAEKIAEKLKSGEKLEQLVTEYLCGELTDEEFFSAADKMLSPVIQQSQTPVRAVHLATQEESEEHERFLNELDKTKNPDMK